MPWLDPSLTLKWGHYTKLDGDEQNLIVTLALAAKTGGIATTRMAVEKIAPVFGIENVDAVLEAIKAESDEAATKEVEKAGALAKATAEAAPKPGQGPPKATK